MGANNADFRNQILFHGTGAALKPGDVILPATALGKPKYYDNDKAWATPDADYAAEIGDIRANRTRAVDAPPNPSYVYEVSPIEGDESVVTEGKKVSSKKGFHVVRQVK
jgi:hypothetical protein